jgi:SAM-dependent methyltransferase
MLKGWSSVRQAQLDDFSSKVTVLATGRKLQKVLDLNCSIGLDTRYLENKGLRVFGLEVCQKLCSQAKGSLKGTAAKVVRKRSFLEHSYKPNSLWGIWCARGWELVPLESEAQYLAEFAKILQPKGWLFLLTLPGEKNSQEWLELILPDKPRLRFQKQNSIKKLTTEAKRFGLILKEEIDFKPGRLLKFQRN